MYQSILARAYPRKPIQSWNDIDPLFGDHFMDKKGRKIIKGDFFDVQSNDLPVLLDNRQHLSWDLEPSTSLGSGLRALLSDRAYSSLLIKQHSDCSSICECCGHIGVLSLHELWDYKFPKQSQKFGLQTLVGLLAVCDDCHLMFHPKAAAQYGKLEQSMVRKMAMQGWSAAALESFSKAQLERQKKADQLEWLIDLSALPKIDAAIELNPQITVNPQNSRFVCGFVQGERLATTAIIGTPYLDPLNSERTIFNESLADLRAPKAQPIAIPSI